MRLATALVLAGFTVSSAPAYAQVDFSGTWTLDREISSDLSKASFDPPPPPKQRSTDGMSGALGPWSFGGASGGRGSHGGGQRPSGGSTEGHAGGDAAGALTVDDHARLRELTDYVKTLVPVMTIAHTDHSTFTVTDAQGRSRLFPTDGATTPQTLSTATIDSVTKWDGPHMVTVYTIGPGRDLVFTYILVPATRQMALRIQLEESGRQRANVPEVRLVYKLTAPRQSGSGLRH